jgi:hypothetical protein
MPLLAMRRLRRWMIRCGTLLLVATPAAKAAQRPLSATFLQFQSWMLEGLAEKDWQAELDAMQKSGIDTIVIQWLKYDQTRFYPAHAPRLDAVETILSYADRHRMQVILGLSFDSSWWSADDDPAFLEGIAARTLAFAAKVARRYGSHQSFAGWYIPYELGDRDYDDEEVAALRSALRRVARGCHKLTGRHLPVAASIFFSGKLPPEAVSGIYRDLIKGSEIDIVIVQDGVGTNQWEGKVKEKAGPYLTQLARAIRQAGAHPWVGIEIFATSSAAGGREAPRLPAPGTRIAEQLEVASPLFERSVMFDFFHYMSPLRGEPQAALQRWLAAQGSAK